jgi:hypothetical protein
MKRLRDGRNAKNARKKYADLIRVFREDSRLFGADPINNIVIRHAQKKAGFRVTGR